MNKPKTKKIKKVAVITLGCAKNQVDSESLMSQLKGNDFVITPNADEADIAIVNTCGFIEDAKRQSVESILSTLQLKKKGKLKEVYVMGCLSQRYHLDLEKDIPEVDRYFGSHDQSSIITQLGGEYKYELLGERELTTPPYTAYLKISEGCSNPCSFCAIPLMRGMHLSKPIEEIIGEAMNLAAKGVKELIVIGQDTTYYGIDRYGKRKLARLLRALAATKEFEWIRLMYAFPAKFPLDVLDVFSEYSAVCRYLDMPVQHASDPMLKAMRRGITRRATEKLIEKIRSAVPGITLRTTIIAGYPGETEKDVDQLLDFLAAVRFDRLGVFTYSPEEGTPAFDLGDPIPSDEKEARRAKIMEVQQRISAENLKQWIGKKIRMVVERLENGMYIGRTERDAPEVDGEIFITAAKHTINPGTFLTARVTDAGDHDLYGTIAE